MWGGLSAQCRLVFKGQFGIRKVASNVSIKVRTLGRSVEQPAEDLRRNSGIGIAAPIAKLQFHLSQDAVISRGSESGGVKTRTTRNRRGHRLASFLGERRAGNFSPRPQTSRG